MSFAKFVHKIASEDESEGDFGDYHGKQTRDDNLRQWECTILQVDAVANEIQVWPVGYPARMPHPSIFIKPLPFEDKEIKSGNRVTIDGKIREVIGTATRRTISINRCAFKSSEKPEPVGRRFPDFCRELHGKEFSVIKVLHGGKRTVAVQSSVDIPWKGIIVKSYRDGSYEIKPHSMPPGLASSHDQPNATTPTTPPPTCSGYSVYVYPLPHGNFRPGVGNGNEVTIDGTISVFQDGTIEIVDATLASISEK